VSGQLHPPAALSPWKQPPVLILGGWLDPRAGLNNVEYIKTSRACRESNPVRPDLGGIYNNLDCDLLISLEVMFRCGVVTFPSSTSRCATDLSLQ
jgi:hypothetical protein